MAPTKKDAEKGEKEAKPTPEQSAALVLDYLRKQNRPYSAIDVSTNLKNRVTKAAAAKLLKDMHERKEIEGRAAGKQIVYHAIQDEADESSVEFLHDLDLQTTNLKETTIALRTEEKDLRLALRDNVAQVPLAELRASVASLEEQRAGMKARLAELQGGNFKPVSAEEHEKVNEAHRKWERTAAARKKIRTELWKEIASHVEKDKLEETKEQLGLEF